MSNKLLWRIPVFLLVSFHLSSIFIHALSSGYYTYQKYNDNKENHPFFEYLSSIGQTKPVEIYGKVSGTNCGYGFFAPNVRSNGILIVEGGGKKTTPVFQTHEAQLRFDGFVGDLINDIIPEKAALQQDSVLAKLEDRYNQLLLKNITLSTLRNQGIYCDNAAVTYAALNIPDMEESRLLPKVEMEVIPMRKLIFQKEIDE